jgi:hypothetical protein
LGLLRASDEVVREPWRTEEAADPVQHLRLAFTEPQAVGTLILPDAVEVGALKADAAFPGDLDDDSQWIAFAAAPGALRVLTAPAGQAATRALRFTFRNDGGKPWRGALHGAHLLPRRFENIIGGAAFTVSSGTVGADGKWETVRETPITPEHPASLIVAWPDERDLARPGAARRVRQTHRGRCLHRPGRGCSGRCAGVGLETGRRTDPGRALAAALCRRLFRRGARRDQPRHPPARG